MTRAEMLAELREVIDDTVAPYAWSDARLLAYLAEGQDKFCEDTGYFRDASTYTLTLVEGAASYAIPDRVIQVMDVKDGNMRLGKFEEADRGEAQTPLHSIADISQSGRPSAWQTDKETGSITLYPTPSADVAGEIFSLRVWRYSVEALNDTGAEPEIPARFQRACVEWASFKAFAHHDQEKQDKIKASHHLDEYRMYVSDGVVALRRYQGQETRVGTAPAYRT